MFDVLKTIYDKITGKKKEKKDESYTKVSEKELTDVINTIIAGRPSNRDVENNTMMAEARARGLKSAAEERYKKEQRNLVHPVTKEVVKPLKNVNDDPLAYIKVLSDATYGPDQWPSVAELIFAESRNDPKAFNGTYRGLFQNNKDQFSSDDPSLDEQWAVFTNYISTHPDARTGKPYGTPSGALDFRNNGAPAFKASGDPRYVNFSEHWY